MKFSTRRIFALVSAAMLVFVISACAPVRAPDDTRLVLRKTSYDRLQGWHEDTMETALEAFKTSCDRILKNNPEKQFSDLPEAGLYKDWQAPCNTLAGGSYRNPRAFFETWFQPYRVTDGGYADEGLFTGYYEIELRGATFRAGDYRYPLLKKPRDLVMVDLGAFREDLKGRRVAGRVINGRLRPYETRAQIERGALSLENARPLAWVNDPVDAFFLHIQGSGRIKLEDGSIMRVGYDGQNGHVYYAIGRELVQRGELSQEDVSLQSIKAWLRNHPLQAQALMEQNPSYVFFRELEGDSPLGAEGVALTAGRSLAVDNAYIPYGAPVWVNIDKPLPTEERVQRLMIAQDTGGAIRGVVRGDVFWGHGEYAEKMAGHMKSQGKMWMLLPKSVQLSL